MFTVTCITTNKNGASIFIEKKYLIADRNGMLLTEQIGAKNFRIRKSDIGYKTDWHLAGDPTLIIILEGILKISLQNGLYQEFIAGNMFIAADNLPLGIVFDKTKHGHTTEVVGEQNLLAIHIKLDNFEIE